MSKRGDYTVTGHGTNKEVSILRYAKVTDVTFSSLGQSLVHARLWEPWYRSPLL